MSVSSIKLLEQELGHDFIDQNILKTALTHASTGNSNNYERLEFLGDRVLGLSIAELLYERFPNEPEGDMAKRLAALVQGKLLAKIARKINLGNYINLSDAERTAGGAENENILADVFEAMLGALYLDANYKTCLILIERLWEDIFYDMKAPPQHPKTLLQEWAQGQGLSLPEYKIIKQSGPDHAPLFDVQLCVQNYKAIIAQGASRQEAEKQAAHNFLIQIGKDKNE